ncbi:MAG: R2-like ligand-binding oxidase [Actinomycetota bacterium]|nr:R2-like ligand-binding oxidase [Actinomycetota bacterium]
MSMNGQPREGFNSLRQGGVRWTSVPMRLFQKGNRLFWNPADLDFSKDAEDWERLDDSERLAAIQLATLFEAGEEAVTNDIQPFIAAMGAEGRLEDEMYLTQFAFEEAKHIELFRRWLDAIGETGDLHQHVNENPGYRKIFYELLPESMQRLSSDHSPAAQVRAAVVYNQVVEGVLALTGYHSWYKATVEQGIMPGMQQAVKLIGRDERRHMAWGTFTCRRHIAADNSLWQVVQDTLDELLMPALSIIDVTFDQYEEQGIPFPFGITREELSGFATNQFSRRLEVIEAAKHRSVAEVEGAEEEEDLENQLEKESLESVPA